MAESRKPAIYTNGVPIEIARVLEPIKQAIEMITGARQRNGELKGLAAGASTDDIICKLNEIVARINASGSDNVKSRR